VRSAFLQGLLLMDPAEAPPRFEPWRATMRSYHEWVRGRGLTPIQAALGFALGLPADKVIVGVNDAAQLEEIVADATPLPLEEFAQWASDETALVDPSTWRL
jgi:aryl-alcohol dehydrogenase-like predicted oxidoreductase